MRLIGVKVRYVNLVFGAAAARGSNDANNQRFRLLLNLIGQNLQDLQYIVFH